MFCNKCGQELPKESVFCNKCGQNMSDFASRDIQGLKKEPSNVKCKKSKELISKLSDNVASNLIVLISSVAVFLLSFNSIKKIYQDVTRTLKLIDIKKNIIDLTYKIYGSALVEKSELKKLNNELFLSISKVVGLGLIIIISVLIFIYFLRKIIPLIKNEVKGTKGVN